MRAYRFQSAFLLAVGVLPRAPIPIALSLEERAVAGLSREARTGFLALLEDLGRQAGDVVEGESRALPEAHSEGS